MATSKRRPRMRSSITEQGHPVHLDRLRPTLQRCARCAAPTGLRGRRLRQRDVRDSLLRDARTWALCRKVRAERTRTGSASGPRPRRNGRVRLHRGLLQPPEATLGTGSAVAHQLRASPRSGHEKPAWPSCPLLPRCAGEAFLSPAELRGHTINLSVHSRPLKRDRPPVL